MYFDYLWRMLEPLGVYRGDGYSGGELKALGKALDGALEKLEEVHCESLGQTAEAEGLGASEALFPVLVSTEVESRRAALRVLYQTDNRCCSARWLESTLNACGIPASVGETGTKFEAIVSLTEPLTIERDPVFQFWLLERIMPCHLITVVVLTYVDVESGETVHERMTLSLLRQRSQGDWQQRLGAYM